MIKGSGIFTKTLNPLFLISIEALTFLSQQSLPKGIL